jgi:HTH-type transcriptional regulator/antitoxin HigA
MANELRPFYNVGPGDIIQDTLDALGWRQEDLADITGLSVKTINKLINNKQQITPETAKLLSLAFSTSAQIWLNLDARYQLRKLEADTDKDKFVEKKAYLSRVMPLGEMRKKGWLLYDNSYDGLKKECKNLFCSEDLPDTYKAGALGFCARQTKQDEEYTNAFSKTWYYYALSQAKAKDIPVYDRKGLQSLADSLYQFTTQAEGVKDCIEALHSCGVGFFVLSHLSKTYLDGAAFLAEGKPFIVYTCRYDRLDNFWFVLAHEISHVLNHFQYLETPFLDNLDCNEALSDREKEADVAASLFLHTDQILEAGKVIGKYLNPARLEYLVMKTQVSLPVALGILAHYKLLDYRQVSKYRQTVKDKIPEKYFRG